jgi:hypothetical protein
MGHLISAHVIKKAAPFFRLRELPPSIGTRVHTHRPSGLFAIETFRPSRPSDWPFSIPLPAADVSLELPHEYSTLRAVERFLLGVGISNGFKSSYVNFCRTVSSLLETPVFSFVADDELWDFSCTVSGGQLVRLKCRCEDLVIEFDSGRTRVLPLSFRDHHDDSDEFGTDLTALRRIEGIEVLPHRTVKRLPVHTVSRHEFVQFAGSDLPFFGLGDIGTPDDLAEWTPVEIR